MGESKTKLFHTRSDEPGTVYECRQDDTTDLGYQIVVDKRTHEIVIPRGLETEDTATVVIKPLSAADEEG